MVDQQPQNNRVVTSMYYVVSLVDLKFIGENFKLLETMFFPRRWMGEGPDPGGKFHYY